MGEAAVKRIAFEVLSNLKEWRDSLVGRRVNINGTDYLLIEVHRIQNQIDRLEAIK